MWSVVLIESTSWIVYVAMEPLYAVCSGIRTGDCTWPLTRLWPIEPIQMTWSGGQPPYYISLIPGKPYVINIIQCNMLISLCQLGSLQHLPYVARMYRIWGFDLTNSIFPSPYIDETICSSAGDQHDMDSGFTRRHRLVGDRSFSLLLFCAETSHRLSALQH